MSLVLKIPGAYGLNFGTLPILCILMPIKVKFERATIRMLKNELLK